MNVKIHIIIQEITATEKKYNYHFCKVFLTQAHILLNCQKKFIQNLCPRPNYILWKKIVELSLDFGNLGSKNLNLDRYLQLYTAGIESFSKQLEFFSEFLNVVGSNGNEFV